MDPHHLKSQSINWSWPYSPCTESNPAVLQDIHWFTRGQKIDTELTQSVPEYTTGSTCVRITSVVT